MGGELLVRTDVATTAMEKNATLHGHIPEFVGFNYMNLINSINTSAHQSLDSKIVRCRVHTARLQILH